MQYHSDANYNFQLARSKGIILVAAPGGNGGRDVDGADESNNYRQGASDGDGGHSGAVLSFPSTEYMLNDINDVSVLPSANINEVLLDPN